MANDNKKKSAAQKAAEAAPEQNPTEEARVKVVTATKVKGLSQGEKVAYLTAVQKERDEIRNSGEGNFLREHVRGLSIIAQAAILDIAAGEIACGTSAMGFIIAKNEETYSALLSMAAAQGIKLPSFKSLPTPTKDQLKAVGLEDVAPDNAVLVKIDKGDVSEETIDKKKKEVAAVAKAVENPAEIKNAEQLKASLTAMLVKPATEGSIDRPDARVQRTIDFYRGYLTIQANHAEKKKEELKKVKELSRTDMLNQISEIVGPCPFALKGAAFLLRKVTNETGSPISAFCLYRRGSVPTGGNPADDQYLADVVRIILIWSCNSQIAEFKSTVKDCEKIIKKNEELVKANKDKVAAAAVKEWNRQRDGYNLKIQELENILNLITSPSLDVVDNLIDDYNAENTESEHYKLAHRIVKNILDTYYPNTDIKKLEKETMLKNVQQRAGIIINMFRDPLNQSISYKESNLTEMVEIEAPAEEKGEESKGEEAPKN